MSESTNEIPVPDLSDPFYAPFWQAAAAGRIDIQACADCGEQRWPPRHRCHSCGSFGSTWTTRTPRGKLYSWTTVARPTAKGYPDAPYSVGIVALEGQPEIRLIGKLTGLNADQLSVGLALRPVFTPAGPDGEMTLIYWEADR